MERVEKNVEVWWGILPAIILSFLVITMILITYGPETISPVLHDIFHDFRHVIGIPCH